VRNEEDDRRPAFFAAGTGPCSWERSPTLQRGDDVLTHDLAPASSGRSLLTLHRLGTVEEGEVLPSGLMDRCGDAVEEGIFGLSR